LASDLRRSENPDGFFLSPDNRTMTQTRFGSRASTKIGPHAEHGFSATRRVALAGFAAAIVAPVALAGPALAARSGDTPIRSLWRQIEGLDLKLLTHASEIANAGEARGLPGWMLLQGEANRLGEERYGKLVAILNARPLDARDLAIVAKASQDADILAGPRGWASQRLALAALGAESMAA
jgi:hypothetical protein